ncbi:MAG TPA: glycosyltransferase family 4 protein [Acidimicrobiales bacterium]|nr:glycosyltransferase family 4 protein [Acidimicrobiales bacterium]
MRILFLHQFDLDLAGGSGTYLRLLVRALVAEGHDVRVVAARRPDRYGCATYALPFDFTLTFGPQRRPGERTFDDLSMTELRALSACAADSVGHQAFDGDPPELLLVNHVSMTADVARRLHERHGVPYRVISYGTDTLLLAGGTRYVEWLRPAAAGADRLFAISAFVAEQLRSVFPGGAPVVLGGAVDATVFRPLAQDEPGHLAYVGRLVTEKGVWTLLDALRRLDRPVVLDVVGEGPLAEPLKDAVAATPHLCVQLHGYLPPTGVRDVLARSAALVVPSLWEEPLGLVVLEAMACGVPVVATAVGGIPEIVQDGRNGLLVEPGDGAALAHAMERVLAEPGLRQRLRDHCLTETAVPSHTDLVGTVLS